jgi:8-oxo-dGTP pyrophosphatase MutT (NUDIX family)
MRSKQSLQRRSSTASAQVAAVCYRIGKSGIEFLLVQTGGGRWTFPKGNVEPGLTHAQSAALEASEEAGVHGRIEEGAFASYVIRKRRAESNPEQVTVHAHLCEVARCEPAQESRRNPTWFSAAKAKRRLREHRAVEAGAEFARVVESALARIQILRHSTLVAPRAQKDPLQEVRLESPKPPVDSDRLYQAFVRDLRSRSELQSSVIQLAIGTYVDEAPRLSPPRESTPPIEGDCATTPVGDW